MKPIHWLLVAVAAGAGYFFYTKSKQAKSTGGFSASINVPTVAPGPAQGGTPTFFDGLFVGS